MNQVTDKCNPRSSEIRLGQIYRNSETGDYYIVASSYKCLYTLICLNDGMKYDEPTKLIEDVFNEDKSKFELVTSTITIKVPQYEN